MVQSLIEGDVFMYCDMTVKTRYFGLGPSYTLKNHLSFQEAFVLSGL